MAARVLPNGMVEDVEEEMWIQDNIHMRICKLCKGRSTRQTHSSRQGSLRCACGGFLSSEKTDSSELLTTSHDSGFPGTPDTSKTQSSSSIKKWNFEDDTDLFPTNAFGEIEFTGFSENKKKYVRVAADENVEDIVKLMTQKWGLEKPNLLISVTGGAKNFNLKSKLKDEFRRGLLKLTKSTGVWIVTGGTNTGVMKHVGEAVRDYELTSTETDPIVAIGIATWGIIEDRHKLIRQGHSSPVQYSISGQSKENECFLDPHHTHFILVDDGTQHKFGAEIQLRAKLEKKISEMEIETKTSVAMSVRIPFIQIVLGGGFGTFATVRETLQLDISVIIVEGTGRAADLLSDVYHKDTSSISKLKDLVSEYIDDEELTDTKAAEIAKDLSEIMKKKHLITLYNVMAANEETTYEIDRAILKALLKSGRKETSEDQIYYQLKLAMSWNRVDIAKSEIFSKEPRFDNQQLSEIIQLAIQMDRVDFVELLMDQGISPNQFVSLLMLLTLYNYIPKSSLLCRMMRRVKRETKNKSNYITFVEVSRLIKELLGDFFFTKYRYSKWTNVDVKLLLEGGLVTTKNVTQGLQGIAFGNAVCSQSEMEIDNPFQHLFLWAVLMNRHDLAMLFWRQGKDPISTGLIGYALFHAMASQTNDMEERNTLLENANDFSNLAWDVLSECQNIDDKKTHDLLKKPQDQWGGVTCVDIAVYNNNRKFISHTACQLLCNDIWMGKLAFANSAFLILACSLFPAFVPVLKFKDRPATIDEEKKPIKSKPKRGLLKRKSTMFFGKTPWRSDKEEQNPRSQNITKLEMFTAFFKAPVVVFTYNVLAYLVFLILHSYILLFNFQAEPSVYEYLIIVYVFSLVMDEIRQILSYPRANLFNYFLDKWNIVDTVSFLLFIIGEVVRFSDYLGEARIILALNLVIFYCRMLHIFSVHKELGPKLVMIRLMLIDLMYFIIILLVFVVAYCVAGYAILFPNSDFTLDVVNDIARFGFWNIYGEPSLEQIELTEPDCTYNRTTHEITTTPLCPTEEGRKIVPIMMAIYMLFSSILLINLVIAMFSYTFKMVQDESDQHWHFLRYRLIMEYAERPILVPPFILLNHVYLVLKWCFCKCCCRVKHCGNSNLKGGQSLPDINYRKISQWENIVADAYIHRKRQTEVERLPQWAVQTNQRLDQVMDRMDQLHVMVNALYDTIVQRTD